jgi:hypothetical protein
MRTIVHEYMSVPGSISNRCSRNAPSRELGYADPTIPSALYPAHALVIGLGHDLGSILGLELDSYALHLREIEAPVGAVCACTQR